MTKRKLLLIFGAIYLVLSVFAMLHFLHNGGLQTRGKVTHRFDAMYNGTAVRPFVGRVLVVTVTKMVEQLTPQSIQDDLDVTLKAWAHQGEMRQYLPALPDIFPQNAPAYPRLVAIMLIYATLLAYTAMMYILAAQIFPDEPAIKYFAPIFALLSIQAFSAPMQYHYDIPVLFLSAGCYYALFLQRFRLYGLFFFFACLNKETAIFLTLFFVLWFYRRLERQMFLHLLGIQVAVFVVIRAVIAYIYSDNLSWFDTHPYFLPVIKDVFARGSLGVISNITVMFLLLTYRWPEKPAFLKTVLWLLPVMFSAYLIYGFPQEYRVFFDLLPLLVLLATHTLITAADFKKIPGFFGNRKESEA